MLTVVQLDGRLVVSDQGVDSCEDEFRNWKEERQTVHCQLWKTDLWLTTNPITASQHGWEWQGLLEVQPGPTPAQAGPPTAGCPGPCPGGF